MKMNVNRRNGVKGLQSKLGYMLFWTLFGVIPFGVILPIVLLLTGVVE